MSTIVALGERERVEGFAVAGVRVIAAAEASDIRDAWKRLSESVAVVILTPAARTALSDLLPLRPDLVWTVIPG